MSQGIFNNIDPTVTTGLMLAGLLDDFKDAIMSGFSGTSRPANLQAGGFWVDTTFEPAPNYYWTLKIYNGTTDIDIFRISVLQSSSGFNLAAGEFTVRRISANTTGAILNLVKNRIANGGQVLSGDTIAELRLTGRTDTPTDPIVAYLRATASENQTATNRGVTLSLVSTPVGTSQLLEHVRFLTGIMEFVQGHKLNSLILNADSVATSASMILVTDAILTELTGSATANIHGIEVQDGETKVKYVHNRSSAEATIKHESLTASAAERFTLPEAKDLVLLPNSSAAFYYCTTDTRWKYLMGSVAGVRTFIYEFMNGYSEWVAPLTGNVRLIGFQEPTKDATGLTTASAFSRGGLKSLLAWGDNEHGQLGLGDVNPRSSPTLVLGQLSFKDAMISSESSFGLSEDQVGYAWGLNDHGQLGVGDVLPRSSPVAIVGGLRFSRLDISEASYGLNYAGLAFAWGRNQHGQLGLGDVASRSSPVAVLSGIKFSALFRGADAEGSVFGVERETGALYAWGQNEHGRLGVGDIASRSSPVAVLGGFKFRKVAVGIDCNIGISESGVAYGWGLNVDGELGVGNTTSRSSPVAVLGGLVFKDVVALMSTTTTSFFGLTEDGVLYGWGANDYGQLGVGDVLPRSSPVAVLGGLKFESIARLNSGAASIVAIEKGTGEAYAWGDNGSGQLGVGDTTARSSPVAVLGGLNFASLSIGDEFVYGYASDGLAYAWGSNAFGQLGDNTIVDKDEPELVLGLTEPLFEVPQVKVMSVVKGTTYKIKLGGGASFFGDTPIGRNIRRATLAFEN